MVTLNRLKAGLFNRQTPLHELRWNGSGEKVFCNVHQKQTTCCICKLYTGTMRSHLPTEELSSWVGKALQRYVSLPVWVSNACFVTAKWSAISGASVCDRTAGMLKMIQSKRKKTTKLPRAVIAPDIVNVACTLAQLLLTRGTTSAVSRGYLERLWSTSDN